MIYNLPLKLRALRKQNNMTQDDVARKAGIDRSTYAGYEKGTSEPSFSTLNLIAQVFGVHLQYFDYEERRESMEYVSDIADEIDDAGTFTLNPNKDKDEQVFKFIFDNDYDKLPDKSKIKFMQTKDLTYTALRALPLSSDEQMLIYAYRLLPIAKKESVLSDIENCLNEMKRRDK